MNKRNDKRKRKKRPLIKLEWQKWSPAVKNPREPSSEVPAKMTRPPTEAA